MGNSTLLKRRNRRTSDPTISLPSELVKEAAEPHASISNIEPNAKDRIEQASQRLQEALRDALADDEFVAASLRHKERYLTG
jgi:hypothetical protein